MVPPVLVIYPKPHENVGVTVPVTELVLVVGLAGFGLRLLPGVRTHFRSRVAERTMARTLEGSVKRANAWRAVAALRERPAEEQVQVLDEPACAELMQRIERLRTRVAQVRADGSRAAERSVASRPAQPLPGMAGLVFSQNGLLENRG